MGTQTSHSPMSLFNSTHHMGLGWPTSHVASDRSIALVGSLIADAMVLDDWSLGSMRLYVGNLSYSTTQDTLQSEFGAYGPVDEVAVITDRETGRPRGFAFVTMSNPDDGRSAIESLNGHEVDGRTITVNEARPKADRPRGGGGGRW